VNNGKIPLFNFLPLTLQTRFRRLVSCKNENPRCLPIQSMNDENTLSRFRISLANVVGKLVVEW